MRGALLILAGVLWGCGSGPEPAPAASAAEDASEEAAAADYDRALKEAEAERRAAGPERKPREPEFAPLDRARLQAMVQFRPGWKMQFSGHFAVMHQVDDATAAEVLKGAETTTLELFRDDPRASAIETPLLICVADPDRYRAYGGAPDTRASYSRLRREIVILKFTEGEHDTFTVLRDAVGAWFKDTSPRETEKKVKFLQEWAERRRQRGR